MKNITKAVGLCLFFIITSIDASFSQTVKDIFNEATPVTYLGIDFTKARVFGETGTSATTIRDKYFPAINNNVNGQTKRYDIQEALRRANISRDLSIVIARNRSIPLEQIKSTNLSDYGNLKTTDIGSLVNAYDFTGKSGIGLLFVAGGMSKWQKAAIVYVVFINMATKKVLLAEQLEGKASGMGFANYWAKPVERIIDQITSSKYNEWKKKYGQ